MTDQPFVDQHLDRARAALGGDGQPINPFGGHRSRSASATLGAMTQDQQDQEQPRRRSPFSPRVDFVVRIGMAFTIFTILGFLTVIFLRD